MLRMESLPARGSNTSVSMSQKMSAGIPSNLRPASHGIISASVLLRDTADSFLQVQLAGTHVRLSKIHKIPPDVDL